MRVIAPDLAIGAVVLTLPTPDALFVAVWKRLWIWHSILYRRRRFPGTPTHRSWWGSTPTLTYHQLGWKTRDAFASS